LFLPEVEVHQFSDAFEIIFEAFHGFLIVATLNLATFKQPKFNKT
jgi:hypothetical protein